MPPVGATRYHAPVPLRVSEHSIRELKDRLLARDAPITPGVLRELELDPRQGARALHAALIKRRDASRAERRRLAHMLHAERELWRGGARRVAGIDEAGMSPLAGPVVAAAVVLPAEIPSDQVIEGVDDSKRIDAARRDELASKIRERAAGVGIGLAGVEDIERHNIYWAGLLAMRRAVEALPEAPDHLLVDARTIPDLPMPQQARPRGDAHHYSIAAASIIAKTHRDRLMLELDERYPGYGFAQHKGYPTAAHQRAIRELGPCSVHRTAFPHFRELLGTCSPAFTALARELEEADDGDALEVVAARIAEARASLTEPEFRKLRTLLARRRNRRRGRPKPVC